MRVRLEREKLWDRRSGEVGSGRCSSSCHVSRVLIIINKNPYIMVRLVGGGRGRHPGIPTSSLFGLGKAEGRSNLVHQLCGGRSSWDLGGVSESADS